MARGLIPWAELALRDGVDLQVVGVDGDEAAGGIGIVGHEFDSLILLMALRRAEMDWIRESICSP